MKHLKAFLFFISITVIFKTSALAQTISGSSQVGVSTFKTYTYSGSYSSGYRWSVVGGTISSSSGLTVNIIWSGSPGTGKVQFYPSRFAFTPHELTVTKYANPPNPSTPSVSGNSCGNKTVTRGNPPSGVTWYWQTSSSGVSTSNSSSTYTKTSSGYVYLRARRNSTGQWSNSSSSVYVTVNHNPSMPSTPSVSTNSCGNKTLTRGNPPSGVTWYWQTSPGGESTGDSGSTYSVASSRTVYLKARNNSSGCWSSARSVFVSVNPTPSTPPVPSISSNSCGNKTVTKPGAPGGHTYYWQTSSGGTSTSNASGSITVTGSQNVYLRSRNDITGCWSGTRTTYVTVNPIPSTASGSNKYRCGNGTLTLSATPGSPGNTIRWYNAASGGTLLHTGTSYTTPSLSSTTTYYAASYNSSTGCTASTRRAIQAVINPIPTLASGNNQSRCGTGTVTLTASPGGSGNTIRWYNASGTYLHTGTTYSPNLSSTTTFYAASYNSSTGCLDSDRKAITATINPPSCFPHDPVVNLSPTSICGSGDATFSISGESCSGGMALDRHYKWYSSPSATNPIHEGKCFTVQNISADYTVYVETHNLNYGTKSNRVSRTVTVNSLASAPTATGGSVCGTGTITLSVNNPSGTYEWYNSSGQVVTTNVGAGIIVGSNGHTLQVDRSSSTHYQVAKVVNGCAGVKSNNVHATVDPIPTVPTGNDASRCGDGTVTLTATVGSNGDQVRWFDEPTGGNQLHVGTTYSPTITSDSDYYVESYNSTTQCKSTRILIEATVNPFPVSPTISNITRCGTGATELIVDGYSANQLAPFNWYSSETQSTPVVSGISSINEHISGDTSIYVSRYDETTLCESTRTEVVVTVQQSQHTTGSSESHCQTEVAVPLTGEPPYTGTWSINGPTSAIVLGNAVDMTALTPGQTYQVTYTYANGVCSSNTFVKDIYVRPNSVAGTIAGDNARCGTGTSTFTLSGHTGTVLQWESRYQDGSGSWSSWNLITDTDDVLEVSPTLNEWSGGIRTYEIKATIQNGECNVVSAIKQITVDPQSLGGAISGSKDAFGATSGNLMLGGETGTVQRWEQSIDGGNTWTTINHTGITYPYNVSVTTAFRAVVKSGICNEATSSNAQITILPIPTVDLGATQNIRSCQNVTLSTMAGYAHYAWYRNGQLISNSNSDQLIVDQPGNYSVTITSSGGATFTSNQFSISSQYLLDENAITTYTYRIPTTEPDSSFCFGVDERSVDVQIFDGLGRPVQQIGLNASPLAQDIVVPVAYDDLGRQSKSYLPYVDSDLTTIYKSNAITEDYSSSDHFNYYMNVSSHASSTAFSETLYEASPLNRSIEQGAAGDAWQLGQNTVKLHYAIADSGEVIDWELEDLLVGPRKVYNSGEIFKNITFDEDSSQTIEYANKQGQMILKKSQVNDTSWAETYYVYDNFGQLSIVLPPEATYRLDSAFFDLAKTQTDRQNFLDVWAFQYDYDGRNRMTRKKVPGAEHVLMVYDQWDRLVLTQDGNQRALSPAQWTFTKYDGLNRPIMTGMMSGTATENEIRAMVNSAGNRAESLDSNGINQYTDLTYPADSLVDTYLTVTYYDNYLFDDHASWNSLGLGFNDPESVLTQKTDVKGQVTGTMTKVLGGGWIRTISYYDDKYRLIQTRSTNHLDNYAGWDAVTNYYDFMGQVTKTVTSHNDGTNTSDITRRFQYDHGGRLMNTYHQLNTETEVLLSSNTYNELGELVEKQLHDDAQSLDYTYNIRGWLQSINDPELTSTQDANTDLFGMKLHYDGIVAALGNDAHYNGNISAMEWSDFKSLGANSRAYAYTYDKLNRLKSADHFDGGSTINHDVSGINYDLNGNILNLNRNGAAGVMDQLDYNYAVDYANQKGGNQLRYVNDISADSTGFDNKDTGTDEDYIYDRNGNMIADANKGIGSIAYNHLNLPSTVILSDSEGSQDSIRYIYDAAGIKLSQLVYDSGVLLKKTDYVGEFIYENDTLQLIQHEEGRIVPVIASDSAAISTFGYQYHLKDHLGNVRLTFSTTPEDYTTVQNMESVNDAGSEPETPTNFVNIPYRQDSNANTTLGGDEVATLNAGAAGVMSLIRVKKNDAMNFSVYANYLSDPSASDLASLAGGLIFNAYNNGASSSGLEGLPTGASSEIGNAVTAMTSGAGAKSSSGNAPKAYLNYIYFDKHMAYHSSGFAQISEAARGLTAHELITLDAGTMDTDGYILVYLSNENNAAIAVNFDDLTINHTIVNDVVSAQDYYPFGLTFNTNQRTASTPQKYKFIGKEEQEWGVLDFGFRMYDAAIGRWGAVDPLAENSISMTPYHYAGNSPIAFFDPNGLDWFYYKADGDDDAGWHWQDGSEYEHSYSYTDEDGKEHTESITLQGVQAAIVFDATDGENLGEGNSLNGDGANLATVTVYGPGGEDDIQTYEGYTKSADPSKWGTVASNSTDWQSDNAYYQGTFYKKPNGLASSWLLGANGTVPAQNGYNPSNGSSVVTGAFIHSTGASGNMYWTQRIYKDFLYSNEAEWGPRYINAYSHSVTRGTSEGCLIISNSDWNNFIEQMGGYNNVINFAVQVLR